MTETNANPLWNQVPSSQVLKFSKYHDQHTVKDNQTYRSLDYTTENNVTSKIVPLKLNILELLHTDYKTTILTVCKENKKQAERYLQETGNYKR